ncbi:MAG: GNAT family N-acetyltransferase [Chloroflexi bacterium]|nr:GNAT family N-acetyltransferase [Chloroflexota bacterium]
MSIITPAPSGYAIERVDPQTATGDVEAQVVALMQAIEHEEVPEDPIPPYEPMAAKFRMRSPFREMRWFGAFHGDRLVGGAALGIDKSGSNAHVRQVHVQVLPQHRRRGVGRALFATVVDEIDAGDGILLHAWTSTRIPAGPAFAERVGAEDALHMRCNQLDVATLDRELMARWARRDPPGFRLEWIDGDVPDRLMEHVLTAHRTMNTMPREGLRVEDWKSTPEMVRDRERHRKESGREHLMLLAIDEASGGMASFTEINMDPRVPQVIWQGGTATVPEYRNRGLGKWVKGRMMLRILEQLPAARYIRTNNAGSNAPMLAINEQMGFRFVWDNVVYQMTLEQARAYLGR